MWSRARRSGGGLLEQSDSLIGVVPGRHTRDRDAPPSPYSRLAALAGETPAAARDRPPPPQALMPPEGIAAGRRGNRRRRSGGARRRDGARRCLRIGIGEAQVE